MKIKILKVIEVNNLIRVYTECEYGKDNLGLSLDSKYLDPVTQKPRYLDEVKKLLTQKYEQQLATEQEIDKDNWGEEIDI